MALLARRPLQGHARTGHMLVSCKCLHMQLGYATIRPVMLQNGISTCHSTVHAAGAQGCEVNGHMAMSLHIMGHEVMLHEHGPRHQAATLPMLKG